MTPDRQPSEYQRRIFEFVASGRGHGVIRATAGSGKTTTLIEIARRLPTDLAVCFLAFSKDAAGELQRRLPEGIEARTVHSAGFRAMARHLRAGGLRPELDEAKYPRLIRRHVAQLATASALDGDARDQLEAYLGGLITFARLGLADVRRSAELRAVARRHNLPTPTSPELEALAHRCVPVLLELGARLAFQQGACDFDDLIHLPHVHADALPSLRPRQFDLVFVDEAQDYSRLALAFTMRLARPHGRMLFVGDPRQSIFGFAGADPGAIDRIVAATHATLLPLSVSYRCPREHVRLARHIAAEIEAAPGAAAGTVQVVDDRALERAVTPGALVLSRTNAPLVHACLRLVRSGRRVRIRGRDLAGVLQGLARRLCAGGGRLALARAVEAHRRQEAARIVRRLGDGRLAREELAEVLDLTACLEAAARPLLRRGEVPLTALLDACRSSFAAEGPDAVVCSTVHRAKGQEAERVILLHPETMPAPDARTRDDILGEECVMFVALTRSKRDLVLVRQPRHDPAAERTERYVEGVRA